MFRNMVVGRTEQAKAAETREVLLVLNDFLSARKIPPQVPKLWYGKRKKQIERWCAPGLREELISHVRERIHNHQSANGCSDRLDEDDSIIKLVLDKLCKEPLMQDDSASFEVLAERHGIEVSKVPGLRGKSTAGAGLGETPSATAACAASASTDPLPDPPVEPTQTRASASDAKAKAIRATQISSLAAVLNASGGAGHAGGKPRHRIRHPAPLLTRRTGT